MKFKSVTFDLDGTLLDTVLAEACRRMLEDLGEPARTRREIHSFVGKGMGSLVERCLTRTRGPDSERLQAGIAPSSAITPKSMASRRPFIRASWRA